MLISALGFALMSALVNEAGLLGIPLLQIIFVRAVISIALSLADIHRAGVHPLGHRRVLLFGRGLSGFLALTGVFYALLHLSMAQATILQYLHPVFTALLAFVFLAERPTAATARSGGRRASRALGAQGVVARRVHLVARACRHHAAH